MLENKIPVAKQIACIWYVKFKNLRKFTAKTEDTAEILHYTALWVCLQVKIENPLEIDKINQNTFTNRIVYTEKKTNPKIELVF